VKAYAAAASSRFRSAFQYRAAAAAGIACQGFWGLILIMGLEAFYAASAGGVGTAGASGAVGMAGGAPRLGASWLGLANGAAAVPPLSSMISYIWLGQAFLVLTPWGPDPEVRDTIRTGSVAIELLKPLDLYSFWLSKALGLKAAQLSLRALPVLIFGGFLMPLVCLGDYRLSPPPTLGHFFAFLVSLVAALFLCAAVVGIFDILLFRTVSAVGATSLAASLVSLGSGLLVPLPVLPPALGSTLKLLPFSGLADAPFRFWTGIAPLATLPASLAHQVGWTIVLVAAGRAVVRRELLRLDILGG